VHPRQQRRIEKKQIPRFARDDKYPKLPLLFLLLCSAALSPAQQTGSNAKSENQTYTFTANSRLVVETVVVKDKKGDFVSGLTANDFTVLEDGVPQTIRIFEHQHPSTGEVLPLVPADEEQVTIYKRLARTQIAPKPTDAGRGEGQRLLVFYFDMRSMPPDDQFRALAAAEKFVRTQMTSADLISIMRFNGGSVDVLQDFTADRDRLLSILQTLIVGEHPDSAAASDEGSTDTGAAFGQDDSEFNLFNTDRQLSALETAAKLLGQRNEKKALLYFASGLQLSGIDNEAQMRATVDAAVRAGVVLWTVDARGLVARAPLGDATQGSPGNVSMYSGAAQEAANESFEQSQDAMYTLAADTGGKAFLDNNDLTRGIAQAQRSISDYYLIGYYSTNSALNGRFRHVKIAVGSARAANLDYRQGYYADKDFSHYSKADKERQLEDALRLEDPFTDLTIAMEIDYFQLNRAEYFVPIVVKIPGRELALAKRFGAEHTVIDFLCEIKDQAGGIPVGNLRDYVDVKLSDATAVELARRPVEYDTGFTLLPGKYVIKFLARDDETGRIGTFQTGFTIPNLNKEKRLPISSVVLSSQRVEEKEAVFNAMHGKAAAKEVAANPLVQDGRKLIPSVTRVFSKRRELYVYLQAYQGRPEIAEPAQPATPVIAFVGFYRDGKNVFETTAKAVTQQPGSRLGAVPINFNIPLAGIAPGRYECQVSVLDPKGQRAAFWVGSIALVP
jgi:VWFA-related protein